MLCLLFYLNFEHIFFFNCGMFCLWLNGERTGSCLPKYAVTKWCLISTAQNKRVVSTEHKENS